MKILTLDDLVDLLARIGLQEFVRMTIAAVETELGRWDQLRKSPRHATHYPFGVIELMPCSDEQHYAFKYVNGHPGNPAAGKLSAPAGMFPAGRPTCACFAGGSTEPPTTPGAPRA